MVALLRKIFLCSLFLTVAYHGYANAVVTCQTMQVEPGADGGDCPEMKGKAAATEDDCCCRGEQLCCSSAVVPYAPIPSLPLLSAPSIPPDQWRPLQSQFSSYIPPVVDPPPRA